MTETDAPEWTDQKLTDLGAKWATRIEAAHKREKDWFDTAEKAETAYLCGQGEQDGRVPDFNILHSNVETIVPSIYNSTPVPDIRPRSNVKDDLAKLVSDIHERLISVQIDDNRLDRAVEGAAQDTFMAGRGIVRLEYHADEQEVGIDADGEPVVQITDERIKFKCVSWRDYREGAASEWGGVPWVAFRHNIPQDEADGMQDEGIKGAYNDPMPRADDDEDYCVWEIWDKEKRQVLWVVDKTNRVLRVQDDPLGLKGFFPMAEPMQPITGTGRRIPVCPYEVYKTLAEELDRTTRRINAITNGLKVRGGFVGAGGGLEDLARANDNELVAIADPENMVAAGGLEKMIVWWPVDKAITVLRELMVQREQTKQSIYEITGISDILRGQGNASETATAQNIKTKWGALRIKKMQRMIERQVRDIFVLTAEMASNLFDPQTMVRAAGVDISQEQFAAALPMLKAPLDHYRIDVESDSTVRADLERQRTEMSAFLGGTAEFFGAMAPIVQQQPEVAGPLSEVYAAFARQFSLGRSAENALEQLTEMAQQSAQQPKPNPEAEAAKMEAEAKAAETQGKMQIEQGKLQLDAERLRLEQARFAAEQEGAQADRAVQVQQVAAEFMANGDGFGAVLAQALSQSLGTMMQAQQERDAAIMSQMSQLSQAIAAMAGPKQVVRDNEGRVIGVEPARMQ